MRAVQDEREIWCVGCGERRERGSEPWRGYMLIPEQAGRCVIEPDEGEVNFLCGTCEHRVLFGFDAP